MFVYSEGFGFCANSHVEYLVGLLQRVISAALMSVFVLCRSSSFDVKLYNAGKCPIERIEFICSSSLEQRKLCLDESFCVAVCRECRCMVLPSIESR